MADNVPITAGSGTSIATDDAGAGGHCQIVKLAISTDGSATLIPAEASNGLDVDVTRVGGDVTVIGKAADGAAVSGNPVLIAGQDGTNVQSIKTDADGELQIDVLTLPALVAGTANIGDVDVLTLPALPAGTNNIGDVDVLTLPALVAGTANIGDVDVLTVPAVAGEAASTINSTSSDGGTALTSTAQAIKASAGSLKGYYIYNPNSTAQFVQFYNTASGSVTVGTTNPLFMLTIPPTAAANLWMQPGGIAFGTAMSWAATSTAGGNGAPTTALDAVAWYT